MDSVRDESGLGLGIDTAKESNQATLLDSQERVLRRLKFANTKEGMLRLISWLGDERHQVRAIIEATGRYHRLCERALLEAGVRVDIVNPRRARALAIGLGVSDKDDRVDADMLARSAFVLKRTGAVVHSLAAQDLRDHSRMIQSIKQSALEFKKRLDGLDPSSAAYQAGVAACEVLEKEVAKQEKIWKAKVKEEPEIYRRYQLILSIRDIGHVTARVVSVELPADLNRPNRQLVAYSGTVPRRDQSGNSEMPPHIMGGNAHLRTVLYMPALRSAHQGRYRAFYASLCARKDVIVRNKGGRHSKALTAVMRKMLAEIVAVVKRDSPWTQDPPQRKPAPAQTAGDSELAQETPIAA